MRIDINIDWVMLLVVVMEQLEPKVLDALEQNQLVFDCKTSLSILANLVNYIGSVAATNQQSTLHEDRSCIVLVRSLEESLGKVRGLCRANFDAKLGLSGS
jgi:hypothetical protein